MYMLDTNISIYIMRDRPPKIRDRLRQIPIHEISISSIVLAELWYGVKKSGQRERNEAALADFLSICGVDAWTGQAAAIYGEIRAALEAQGRTIGGNDLLIAAHALSKKGAILVTNDGREFERVPGLQVENWL